VLCSVLAGPRATFMRPRGPQAKRQTWFPRACPGRRRRVCACFFEIVVPVLLAVENKYGVGEGNDGADAK